MPTQIASSERGIGRSPAISSVIALSQAASATTAAKDQCTEREHATGEARVCRATAAARRPIGRYLRHDVDVGAEPHDTLLDELERLVEHGGLADDGRDDVECERTGLAGAHDGVHGGRAA